MRFRLYRFRELLWVLVYRDLRGRTRASLLGYSWIVLQPLLATGIFVLLVQGILKLQPSGEIPYPVFIFAGMVLWNYFSGSLTTATTSMAEHADLLRQVNFPRETLVLYPIISKTVDFLVGLVMLVLFCFLYGIKIQPSVMLAPIFLVPVLFLGYGLALILSPLNVALRDVGRTIPILLSFAIYAAPVLYPLEKVPVGWRPLYLLNPMASLVENFRQLILGGQLSDEGWLGLAFLASFGTYLVGRWIFGHVEALLADIV